MKFISLLPVKIVQLLATDDAISVSARNDKLKLLGFNRNVISDESLSDCGRFISAFENSPFAYAIGDQHGYILAENKAAFDIVGYEKEELFGKKFYRNRVADGREKTKKDYANFFSGKSYGYNVERRYLHKQGHVVWCDINVPLISGIEGKPSLVIVQAKDINARKQDYEKLQESNERFQNSFENAAIGMALGDRGGFIQRGKFIPL